MDDQTFLEREELERHYANIRKRLSKQALLAAAKEEDEVPRSEEKKPEPNKLHISEEMLKQYNSVPVSPRKALIRKIIMDTEDKHGFVRGALKRRSRKRMVVRARQEAMFRLKTEAKCGYAEIGRIFEMDHTTIIHGVRKYETERG